MRRTLACLLLIVLPLCARAETGWHHSTAPMGQFEGGYEAAGGAFISYGCSDLGAHVMIGVEGMHIAAGKARLIVDGAIAFEGPMLYNSQTDMSHISFDGGPQRQDWQTAQLDRIIDAIAGGQDLTLESPNGETFRFPLKGSSEIRNCR